MDTGRPIRKLLIYNSQDDYMPKGSCEPNNDENLQRSDWKQKCIGHGHDCFHMEHCSLSPACSFIYTDSPIVALGLCCPRGCGILVLTRDGTT